MGLLVHHDHKAILERILTETVVPIYDYNHRVADYEIIHACLEDAYQDIYGGPAGRILYRDLCDEMDDSEMLAIAREFYEEVAYNVAYG